MNKIKRAISLMLVLTLLFCLASCGGNSTSSDTSDSTPDSISGSTSNSNEKDTENISSKDTLVVVSAYTDPGSFSSYLTPIPSVSAISSNIMESLLLSVKGEWIPNLAESYEYIDDSTFHITIRDDVYFHNGDKMTVEDVIFTHDLCKTTAANSTYYKSVESYKAIDDRTIEYKLSYQDVNFMMIFSNAVTCKAYYEEVGDQGFALHPVGTGYYMWDSYVSGDSVTLKAFDKYWGNHGTIQTLIIRFITETSQALIELENGNVNVMTADGSTISSVEGNDAVSLYYYENGLLEYCGFNFNSDKIKDIRVRQALQYCIDRNALVNGAREGLATEQYGMVMTRFPAEYNSEVENYYNYNIEKAKELMAECGYSSENPLELNLLTDTAAIRNLEAQQIKNMADQVGFSITIKSYESATITSILAGGSSDDYDIFMRAIGEIQSTTPQFTSIFSCTATEAGNNPFWFTRDSIDGMAEFDDFYQEITKTMNDEERYEKLKELQIMEREMVLCCWLLNQNICAAMSSNLRGIRQSGVQILFDQCYFVED